MPGVADRIRRTKLIQEQKERGEEIQEVIRMIKEDRLHEADSRQLGLIKAALDISNTINDSKIKGRTHSDVQEKLDKLGDLESLVTNAVEKVLGGFVQKGNYVSTSQPENSTRPQMEHVSISDIKTTTEKIDVNNPESLGTVVSDNLDGRAKLERLRKIKGK